MRSVVAAALFAAMVTPSLAQEFFVVQDSRTKRCQIVDVRPSGPDMVVVGPGGQVFATRDEASRAMTTIEVCKSSIGNVACERHEAALGRGGLYCHTCGTLRIRNLACRGSASPR